MIHFYIVGLNYYSELDSAFSNVSLTIAVSTTMYLSVALYIVLQ